MYHTHQTASASQQSWESAAKTNERQFSSGRPWSSLKCAAIRLSVEHRARRRELARPRRLRRNPTRATRTDASVSIIIISVVVISATAAAACVRGENDGTQVPASWPVTGCHLRRALLQPPTAFQSPASPPTPRTCTVNVENISDTDHVRAPVSGPAAGARRDLHG